MRVALVQVASPDAESISFRRDRVSHLLAGAAGADLVVLPELWAPGYFSFGSYEESAEALDGETVSAGRSWARELGCHLHLGSILERDPSGSLHNTAVLIDPAGEVVHTYRKIHVFGYRSKEATLLTPGDRLDVAQTPLGPVAATTCYDLRFPELWRALVDAGAETVVVPAAWPAERLAHWRLLTSARAVEDQVVVVAVNAVGHHGGVSLGGHSRVVDPWGNVLAEAGTEEGVTLCEVDPAAVGAVRAEFPVLADRRPLPSRPLDLLVSGTGERLRLDPERLVIAGYTGRDEAAVAAHIGELAEAGIPPPPTVPCFYDLDPALVSTADALEVEGGSTSGEVEPVLVRHAGRWYLGVGSDHTDRDLERSDIAASKAACPKALGRVVTPLEAGAAAFDWDGVEAWSVVDGRPYQQGSLAVLLPPATLLGKLGAALGEPAGDLVVYGGTLPVLGGGLRPGRHWNVGLRLPGGAALVHSYEVRERGS